MKIFDRIKSFLPREKSIYDLPVFAAQKIPGSQLSNPSRWTVDFLGGGTTTNAGASVTEISAMRCTTILKCVRILSETVASIPLPIYERQQPRGKSRATGHPLYFLLHDQVNPIMTSMEWREVSMVHLTLWGNAYAELQRKGSGDIAAIWPLLPDHMRVEADTDNNRLLYFYTNPDGREQEMDPGNILHIKGISTNGYVGQSVIGWARESIGLNLSAEEYGARFFSNDATPSGVLTHPGTLKEPARQNLKKSFEENHGTLSNKHRMQILEEGMKFETIGIPMEDAQFIETRKYQERDIAAIYRIPMHMLNELSDATFSNIEHQGIEFVVHTLRPWLVRWEQAMKRDLFFPDERERYFPEFLVDGLLRGDIKSRYEAYQVGREWGWLTPDEIRELENMNPTGDDYGKKFIVPLNFTYPELLGQQQGNDNANGSAAINNVPVVKKANGGIELNGGHNEE